MFRGRRKRGRKSGEKEKERKMEGKAGERERKYEPQSFIIFMYSAFISNIFTASHNQTSKY